MSYKDFMREKDGILCLLNQYKLMIERNKNMSVNNETFTRRMDFITSIEQMVHECDDFRNPINRVKTLIVIKKEELDNLSLWKRLFSDREIAIKKEITDMYLVLDILESSMKKMALTM